MVIIALDFDNREKALNFLNKFNEELFVKVGMELFYKEGSNIIKDIKSLGHKVFLDLKLHDIPNTVKSAISNLSDLNVDLINVHALGGYKMMSWAKEALLEKNNNFTKIIAVTQLTSTDKEMLNNELGINGDVIDSVTNLALLTKKAKLDGVVCSPLEVEAIKKVCGKEFITVTPGIRPNNNSNDDQVRITTPEKARLLGTDYIVVGRPITRSNDPVLSYNQIKKEFIRK